MPSPQTGAGLVVASVVELVVESVVELVPAVADVLVPDISVVGSVVGSAVVPMLVSIPVLGEPVGSVVLALIPSSPQPPASATTIPTPATPAPNCKNRAFMGSIVLGPSFPRQPPRRRTLDVSHGLEAAPRCGTSLVPRVNTRAAQRPQKFAS